MSGKIMLKRGKYGVAPKAHRTVDGIVFASKLEMTRYKFLRGLERQGIIRALRLQPVYGIVTSERSTGRIVTVAKYIADFSYIMKGVGEIVEDVKGVRTAIYKLKKKLVETAYGITITEITPSRIHEIVNSRGTQKAKAKK